MCKSTMGVYQLEIFLLYITDNQTDNLKQKVAVGGGCIGKTYTFM